MLSLRTNETEAKYAEWKLERGLEKGCPMCTNEPFKGFIYCAAVKEFTYWKIVINDFPYDKVAEKHHMLVPLRHVTEGELTEEEKQELQTIKPTYLNDNYQFIIEATHKTKSVPEHFHLHLIVVREL